MEIKEAIETLIKYPKGYISKKVIKNKTYYYFQYVENNRIISKYIKKDELESYELQITLRNEAENEFKQFKKSNTVQISKNHLELTGYIMCGDKISAKFRNGVLEEINEQIAPLYIKRTHDIKSYLASRTLDLSRKNARILLQQMGIDNTKEELIALHSNGACIQDNYWFKPLGSPKKYKDVCFNNDLYSDVALKGKMLGINGFSSTSPEITNIGSFEKCWKRIDGKWWIYKAGNKEELFSEYFIYNLANLLGMPIAKYELDGSYIRSLNFAEKYNFEPMFSLADTNENYSYVFDILYNLNHLIAEQYLKLIWFDTIVYNVDRHNFNYGLLRDKRNGKIISLAPNFDNNLALISVNKELNQKPEYDGLIKEFINLINLNNTAKTMFKDIDFPILFENYIEMAFSKSLIYFEKDKIKKFIINRFDYLMNFKSKL